MNHKAHAHQTQMSADAQLRHLQDQLRERDETIVRLQAKIAELEARPVKAVGEINAGFTGVDAGDGAA